jgi:demethylmenaquinone methyltransferase/2-methoxy-6-polyprenyl-1,4-benzoquinol methylase
MGAPEGGQPVVDTHPDRIRAMFDAVASRYDLLNRILSLGQDRRWRRISAERIAGSAPAGPILDLACGTGDLTRALSRANARSHRNTIAGADFSRPMLRRAAAKAEGIAEIGFLQCDGMHLPLRNASLAGIAIAFGLRNFADQQAALDEFVRVLKPGGVLGVLEFTRDRAWWMEPFFVPWQRVVIPTLGRLLSRSPGAYKYLPESVRAYTDAVGMWDALRSAGLEPLEERSFSGGICRLFLARHGS